LSAAIRPKVPDVGDVVVVDLVHDRQFAGDQRLDDPPDAGLVQPGGEGLEVRGAGEDEPLLRGAGMLRGDRYWRLTRRADRNFL
jgi:hypothetical protein